VRTLGPVVLLILTSANALALPAVANSSAVPETDLLVLLGGGLVGLASFIRRYLRD
jgi:hypothetical protein